MVVDRAALAQDWRRMTDRQRWGLRGPVRSCRNERTLYSRRCGAEACETEERSFATVAEFHPNGALARQWHLNPDGSEWTSSYEYDYEGRMLALRTEDEARVYEYDSAGRLARGITRGKDGSERVTESYSYDSAGRKKKTLHVDLAAQRPGAGYFWAVEGTDSSYSAPGTATVTTVFDDRDRPVGLLLADVEDRFLTQVEFRYDEAGNLVEEATTNTEQTLPPAWVKEMTPAQLETMRALLGIAGEPVRRLHRYDQHGRRIETRSPTGPLGENRKTVTYNELGDQAEEIVESTYFERGFDQEGRFSDQPTSEKVTRTEARFLYDYDNRGNWVKRVIEGRGAPEQDFTESSAELRTLANYDESAKR